MPDRVPPNLQPEEAAELLASRTRVYLGHDPANGILRLLRDLYGRPTVNPASPSPPSTAFPASMEPAERLKSSIHIPPGRHPVATARIVDALASYYIALGEQERTFTPTVYERAATRLHVLGGSLRAFAVGERPHDACARQMFAASLPTYIEYPDFSEPPSDYVSDRPFIAAKRLSDLLLGVTRPAASASSAWRRVSTHAFHTLLGSFRCAAKPNKLLTKRDTAFLCYAAYVHLDQRWTKSSWPDVRRRVYLALSRLDRPLRNPPTPTPAR
jgi:hypothetical protein